MHLGNSFWIRKQEFLLSYFEKLDFFCYNNELIGISLSLYTLENAHQWKQNTVKYSGLNAPKSITKTGEDAL